MAEDIIEKRDKAIVIKITPRVIERSIYILIIIVLLAVIIFQNIGSFPEKLKATANKTETKEAATAATTAEPATVTQPETTPAPEPTPEPETTTEDETGEVTLSISNIQKTVINNGTTGKITSFHYLIDNQKKDLRARLIANATNPDTEVSDDEECKFNTPIKKGVKKAGDCPVDFYFPASAEITITFKLFDLETSKQLGTTITETLTFE